MLEINAFNLRVKKMIALTNPNSSQIKEEVGMLTYAPAYKGAKVEVEEIADDDGDENL